MVTTGRVSTKLIQVFSLIGLLIFAQSIFAQNVIPKGSIAVVNGSEIPTIYFDMALKSALSHGETDSADLRDLIKRKLITTAVLSQKSVHAGLDNSALVQASISQARENILAEALLSNFVLNNPISDSEVKSEYERQIALLGPSGTVAQYQVSDIAVQSEEEANNALAKIKKGESFASVAKAMSLAPSKANSGSLGWIYLTQLPPTISKVVANMSPGSITTNPINSGNAWYLVRVDAKRFVKPPSFSDAQSTIRNDLMQKKINAYVADLMNQAKITQ